MFCQGRDVVVGFTLAGHRAGVQRIANRTAKLEQLLLSQRGQCVVGLGNGQQRRTLDCGLLAECCGADGQPLLISPQGAN